MKLTDYTIEQFAAELASGSPAPGGGSVAALCGALGAALASMVANLTVGREKYRDSEEAMRRVLSRGDALRADFLALIDEDAAAFDAYMAARKLPRGTDAEKTAREEAVEKATKMATTVPLRTLEACAGLAELAREAALHGNPNALSDAGVAALLAVATAKSAAFNVRINLPGIKDGAFAADCRARMTSALAETDRLAREAGAKIEAEL